MKDQYLRCMETMEPVGEFQLISNEVGTLFKIHGSNTHVMCYHVGNYLRSFSSFEDAMKIVKS